MIKVRISTVASKCATVTTNQSNVTYRITKEDGTVLDKHFIKATDNANSIGFLPTNDNRDNQESIGFGRINDGQIEHYNSTNIIATRVSDIEFEIEDTTITADHICILRGNTVEKMSSITDGDTVSIEVLCDGGLDFPSTSEVEKSKTRGRYNPGGCEDMLEDVGTALEALGRVIKGIGKC